MDINNEIYDLVQLEAVEKARIKRKDFNIYKYNDEIPVPRVTKIIADCMNTEWLIKWASELGWYGYLREKDFATSVGSQVHEMVEYFLRTGEDMVIGVKESSKAGYAINKAYGNFKRWYNDLLAHRNKIEILGLEVPIITPFYAGTLDLICKINSAVYILDIKTSKKISYDYLIQVAAYKWAVDNGYCEIKTHVDGVGIIRIDKESDYYEDLVLNEFNPYQNQIIEYYTKGFFSILSTYYNKINMEYNFRQYFKQYPGLNNVINNIIDTPVIPEEEV